MTLKCFDCYSPLMPGPRGGAAQNFYCTNRDTCRQGFNITIVQGDVILQGGFFQRIGEVDDERFAMYSKKPV